MSELWAAGSHCLWCFNSLSFHIFVLSTGRDGYDLDGKELLDCVLNSLHYFCFRSWCKCNPRTLQSTSRAENMSENSEKCPIIASRHMFLQTTIQNSNRIKQNRKVANPHIGDVATRKCLAFFCLKNYLKPGLTLSKALIPWTETPSYTREL